MKDPTPDQRLAIETWGAGLAIWAGAGSGKTSTLVAKCLALLAREPKARFAIASFTERSALDLREKLSAALGVAEFSRHRVGTIHGLCRTIIQEFPTGLTGEEQVLDTAESEILWRRVLDTFWLDPDLVPEAKALLAATRSRVQIETGLARLRRLAHGADTAEPAEQGDGAWSDAWQAVSALLLQEKKRRERIDFDDLESYALASLRRPEVSAYYRQRFALVLVDEFQDTSPIQAKIIGLFAKEGGANLVVVGDPKQSIYRFRDADVSVFEAECAKLPHHVVLSKNFRSEPAILGLVNKICEPIFKDSSLPYARLEAGLSESTALEPVTELRVRQPMEFALHLKHLLSQGLLPGSKALLLRRIRGSEEWWQALEECGVPFQSQSGSFFWSEPIVCEMAAALRFWSDPTQELSGATLLRAPWVAVPDQQIDAIFKTEAGSRVEPKRLARALEGCTASDDPLAKIAQVFRQSKPLWSRPGELVLGLIEAFSLPETERRHALRLWHWLEDLSFKGLGTPEILAALERRQKANPREAEDGVANPDVLSVLTVHASKGLEFDHVFVADLGPRRASRVSELAWGREEGLVDAPSEQWKACEREANLAESKRAFYVALTRAKKTLWLVTDADRIDTEGAEDWEAWIRIYGGLATALPSGTRLPVVPENTPGAPLDARPLP